jgi:hypothetical protein
MPTIREMLDKPEDHPGLYKAVFGIPMQIKAGGPGSGRHKQVLGELKHIDPDDLTKAEKQIKQHAETRGSSGLRTKVQEALRGIDHDDLSTAERNIQQIMGLYKN